MSIHLNLTPATVLLLNELAGGERHKSEYIEQLIPLLHRATSAVYKLQKEQQAQVIAMAVGAMLSEQEEGDS